MGEIKDKEVTGREFVIIRTFLVQLLADVFQVLQRLPRRLVTRITLCLGAADRGLELYLQLEVLGEESVELVGLGCDGGENGIHQVGGRVGDGNRDVRLRHTQMGSQVIYINPHSRHRVR